MAKTKRVKAGPLDDRLRVIAERGSAAEVEACIREGARVAAVSDAGYTALHAAASQGNVPTIEALIRAGAPLEAALDNALTTPLGCAVGAGHLAAVVALLAAGARHDVLYGRARETALHSAVRRGRADIARALLAAGATALPSKAGMTPLAAAVMAGDEEANVETVRVLVAAGMDPSATSAASGASAVALAKQLGRTNILAVLEAKK